MKRAGTSKALSIQRAVNLRQLLLATSRMVNVRMTAELQHRGHRRFRITHFNLYSNIDFDGTRLNVLAARANMTKQAMWLLANELEKLGYVTRKVDSSDRRNRIIALTDAGNHLMLQCIDVLEDIEAELEELVGSEPYTTLRETLIELSRERRQSRAPKPPTKGEPYSPPRRSRSPRAKRTRD